GVRYRSCPLRYRLLRPARLDTIASLSFRLYLNSKAMGGKRSRKSSETPFKPSKAQLVEAKGKTVPDVIAKNLCVLFCGINPGLYTAAVGHHFATPGNRFWPALRKS